MDVDLLTLYAYADRSLMGDRELWREFLVFLLPMLTGADSAEAQRLIDEAMVKAPEDLMAGHKDTVGLTRARLVRSISWTLAGALGLPPEIGLAAFVEFSPPTRVHAQRGLAAKNSKQVIISRWLTRYARLQKDSGFVEQVNMWMKTYELCADVDEEVEQDEGEQNQEKVG